MPGKVSVVFQLDFLTPGPSMVLFLTFHTKRSHDCTFGIAQKEARGNFGNIHYFYSMFGHASKQTYKSLGVFSENH